MNEKIDLTKILKDCPKGTEFYSRCLGVVKFESIDDTLKRIIVKNQKEIVFYKENGAYYYADEDAEIDLFPSKDQRDWSKWQRPFVDGDIIFSQLEDKWVSIFKEYSNEKCVTYVDLSIKKNNYFDNTRCLCEISEIKEQRLATEEEKQRLFDAIKANGYRWNSETKTLVQLIVPKFKVGDKIKHRLTGDVYKVVFILSNECGGGVDNVLTTNEIGEIIYIGEPDNYELLPDKFNPKFFKPFDKVLVRDYSGKTWVATFFSHINNSNQFWYKFVTIGGTSYKQMIPYNDATKHLLGTNNEAPEYYKCWEVQ